MKKYLLLIFVILIPFVVKAEDSCESVGIMIDDIELISKPDTISFNDLDYECNNIYLDLIMREVDDVAKFEISIKNVSSEDLEVNKDSLVVNSDYIKYELKSLDSSNIIKPKESKVFSMTVNYVKEVPVSSFVNGKYIDSKNLVISLSNDKKEEKNPNTSTGLILIACLVLSIAIFVVLIKLRAPKYYSLFIIGLIFAIPFTVYALTRVEVKIESYVSINQKVNGTIYTISSYKSKVGNYFYYVDSNTWWYFLVDGDEVHPGWIDLEDPFNSYDECMAYLETIDTSGYSTKYCSRTGNSIGLRENEYSYTVDNIDSYFYLKHIINNDIVDESYTCYNDGAKEYCMKYGDTFENNQDVLDSLFEDGECNYYNPPAPLNPTAPGGSDIAGDVSYMKYYCSSNELNINAYVDTDGNMGYYYDSFHCVIETNGYSYCPFYLR